MAPTPRLPARPPEPDDPPDPPPPPPPRPPRPPPPPPPLPPPPPADTTPSITSWTRLEPQTREADMRNATQARLYDPLWLLARQWQVGEFQGEDAGTPVLARVRAQTARLSRCHLGPLPDDTQLVAAPYDSDRLPLEALVERQRVRPVAADGLGRLRLRIDAGRHFLRLLARQALGADYATAFVGRYALAMPDEATLATLDADTLDLLTLAAGRVPDARRLDAALRAWRGDPARIDPPLRIAAADRAGIVRCARLWLAWYATLFSEPAAGPEAWVPERLEHSVSIAARLGPAAADERALSADEIGEGHLDWPDFDLNLAVNLGTAGDTRFETRLETTVPAPVGFRGMPAARFWEFEDARVEFGLTPVGPADLAQLMLIEYASSYGNDWFVVPLELPVGSVTSLRSLVVVDSFGVACALRPIGDPALPPANWRMFQHSWRQGGREGLPHGAEPNLMLLAPAVHRGLQGPTIEEVLFLRDEAANLAWAVEHAIESPAEQSLRRETTVSVPATGGTPALPVYRLASPVPEAWIPLLPVRLKGDDGVERLRLQRGAVLHADGTQRTPRPRGRLLATPGPLQLHDEEVPREGVRLCTHWQLARWVDGSTHLWFARRHQVGRGEGSSGLRFDELDEGPPP